MNTVTKKELIDRITEQMNKTRTRAPIKGVQVKRVVQGFLNLVIEELAKGNRLEFRDFGVFESKLRAARIAQNPKTLERVHVPAKRSVKFKVGRLMKEKLLQGPGISTGMPMHMPQASREPTSSATAAKG